MAEVDLFAVAVDDLEQRLDDGERRAREQSSELWKLSVSVSMLRKLIAAARERDTLKREVGELRGLLSELNQVYRDEQEPDALDVVDCTTGSLASRINAALRKAQP